MPRKKDKGKGQVGELEKNTVLCLASNDTGGRGFGRLQTKIT